MEGICALFKIDSELRESHIFPRFVVNYTKQTGSKYLRRPIEPNKRLQDAVKFYLLSEKAEQEFSAREKWFAENIFKPYLSSTIRLKYDENLYYFSLSFLWRGLLTNLKFENLTSKWYYDLVIKASEEWRQFLAQGLYPQNYHKVYMLLTDRVGSHDSGLKGVDHYFTRAMDATIVTNPEKSSLFIYGKFNRFIFWIPIIETKENFELSEALINPISGEFNIPQKINYFPLSSFLGNRIKGLSEFDLPNDEQQMKIEKEILKNPEEFWDSDLGKSLLNDLDLE